MEIIRQRLRELRESANLTQSQMASILGVQQSRVAYYENGKSAPTPEVFLRYADYFNVSMDYLYGRTEQPEGAHFDYDPATIKKRLSDLVRACFDLRPAAIIERLGLRRPIYVQTSAYGHFGREELNLPWETVDMTEALLAKA